MARRRKPLPLLEGAQAAAVDPRVHATLSASAGTGKTQVLTGRVLRLLLSGAAPETILCLTFTKAGAAEMANRIGAQLASWVRMKDADLKKDLFALGERNDPVTQQRARRLFARVLDAPGGLRIQTIHSFAQALLASFPEEAGIAPGFQPIEGRAEQELARTTLANLLAEAEANGNAGLLADVQRLSLRGGEDGAVAYLLRCARAPEAMAAFGRPDSIEPLLRRLMDLPEESLDDYLTLHCGDDRFDCDLLRAIADANRRWATATGAKVVENVEGWLAMDGAARATALPELALVVFTGSGELRKVSAGQRNADPDYDRHAERLADAIGELLRIQNGARLAADMAAGLRAGQAFAAAYAAAKRSAGVADFDDLIAWTRGLLSQPGIGEWVRFKLDRRTDHSLVDESQDTNRAQWEIVQALAGEYFTGSSEAEDRHRTIFMVGDFKQAIFRFQGTDPAEFRRAADWVREHSEALREAVDESDRSTRPPDYRDLSIESSFRSAPAVLDVVDAVIAEIGHSAMGLPAAPKPHQAHFDRRPGEVVLLKPYALEQEDGDGGDEGWLGEDVRRYAGELASEVRRWLDEKPVLATTRQPLSPGDILVLVRSRGELASLIVARLFAEGVPVAGIDRLHLHKPLAVKDLLAAIQFAVQPLDDLNLANLLVSPLVGWGQDLLLELSYDRKRAALWDKLRERAGERPDFTAARELLGALLAMADYTTPHRFLETILSGSIDGRRKLYCRLGLAARDPVEELLSSALEFERTETASLDRFLAWFNSGEVEIKRDPSAPANAVRVMTVHGAKGLEAPVVLLADATADPSRLGGPALTLDFPIPGVGKAPLLRPRKAERVPPFEALIDAEEQADLEEHWRLLYVALTRAKERLVIAGLDTSNSRGEMPANCWHSRVERALTSLGAVPQPHDHWRESLAYRGAVPPAPVRPKAASPAIVSAVLPDWARTPAPVEARPPRPLAPSAILDDKLPSPPPGPAQVEAARRGVLLHRLFERLPGVEPALRRESALHWLEHAAGVSDAARRTDLAEAACAIIDDPAFVDIFGPASFAEAPIAATLGDGRVVAGTIDRLLVEPGRVRVIDFKTGAKVPPSASDVPRSHFAQMTAYAEALRVIFPGSVVEASLLYTAGPKLVPLTC
jgi:ATP-dependent helicase/nuclease subunit A